MRGFGNVGKLLAMAMMEEEEAMTIIGRRPKM
jgi:hypothetical protein